MVDKSPMSQYIVVIRGGSRLRFEPDEHLKVKMSGEGRDVHLTFMTQYVDEGFETQVPRELWIDARGPATSLDAAATEFTNMANFFATVLSFCANGFGGKIRFHFAYDATPKLSEREFFEQFVEDARGAPLPSRLVRPALVSAVLESLATHEHTERLRRAIIQYVLALQYWSQGEQILSVAHLFMGIEALVPVVRKMELIKQNLKSNRELAEKWNIPIEELDSHIRQTFLFESDQKSHRAAKRASDAVEHGFLDYDNIRKLAVEVRNQTAAYLRKSIIKILQLSSEVEQQLLAPPYDIPIGTEGYIRYLRGNLKAEHDQLAQEGQIYPLIEWRFNVESVRRTEEGKYQISFSQKFTPRLGDDVSFLPSRVEIYGPEGVQVDPPVRGEIEPEIISKKPDFRPVDREEFKVLLTQVFDSGGVVEEVKIRTREGELLLLRAERNSDEEE